MKGIKIEYIVDNESWTEEEFEANQDIDREFFITEDMIIDLIKQNSNLGLGDFIHSYNVNQIIR